MEEQTPNPGPSREGEEDGLERGARGAAASADREARDAPPAPKAPPFPLTRVVLPLAGIAVAAWLWLGAAWSWDVTPADLARGKPPPGFRSWKGRYVTLSAGRVELPEGGDAGPGLVAAVGPDGPADPATVVFVRAGPAGARRGPARFRGRVTAFAPAPGREGNAGVGRVPVVDPTRGRMNSKAWIAAVLGLWGAAILCSSVALWVRGRGPAGGESAEEAGQP